MYNKKDLRVGVILHMTNLPYTLSYQMNLIETISSKSMSVYEEAKATIYFWGQGNNTSPNDLRLLDFIFYTLDVLYDVTRKLPERTKTFESIPLKDVTNFFVLGLPDVEYYKNIRLALTLVNDLYFLLKVINDKKYLVELNPITTEMCKEAHKFKEIRNFCTHIDERISNLEKHGIDGIKDTSCGIRYGSDAKNCFHLVVGDGEIYFSDKKKDKFTDISKSAFDPIFKTAKELFNKLADVQLPDLKRSRFLHSDKVYPL